MIADDGVSLAGTDIVSVVSLYSSKSTRAGAVTDAALVAAMEIVSGGLELTAANPIHDLLQDGVGRARHEPFPRPPPALKEYHSPTLH